MQPVLKAVDNDVEHTVFSFIPNTAEVAFYGLLNGFAKYNHKRKIQQIMALGHAPTEAELHAILDNNIRSEKVTWKDIKLRTRAVLTEYPHKIVCI